MRADVVLVLATAIAASVAISRVPLANHPTVNRAIMMTQDVIVHAFADGLAGVRASNADIKLAIGRDAALGDEQVLTVSYPSPSADPAGRDIRLDAQTKDWSAGKAIVFQVKPTNAIRISVSFVDRNHVVYTSWTNLQAGSWQSVRIAFDAIRPNPYFQPPDAKAGSTLDVSEVHAIAFAPQDQGAGQIAVGRFVIVR